MTRLQRTLRTAVEFAGRGLHSGIEVHARALPAPQGTGVEFVRTDLPDAPPIPARIAYQAAERAPPRACSAGRRWSRPSSTCWPCAMAWASTT